MRPWLAAVTSQTAWIAGLGLGLPAFSLIFLIAVSADVSVVAAFGRGLIALLVLGAIGWLGGAVLGLSPKAGPTRTTAGAVGRRIDLVVPETGPAELEGRVEAAGTAAGGRS